jgi:hypothetical protein
LYHAGQAHFQCCKFAALLTQLRECFRVERSTEVPQPEDQRRALSPQRA